MNRIALAAIPYIALIGGCAGMNDRNLAQNKGVVRRMHAEVWSNGNLDVVGELVTEDFVCHFAVGPEWRGPSGLKDRVSELRSAFPDWNERIEDIIAEGDRVVTRFTSTGTNLGEFQGVAASGRKVKIAELAVFRLVNGKIAEQWLIPDQIEMRRQIGIESTP